MGIAIALLLVAFMLSPLFIFLWICYTPPERIG